MSLQSASTISWKSRTSGSFPFRLSYALLGPWYQSLCKQSHAFEEMVWDSPEHVHQVISDLMHLHYIHSNILSNSALDTGRLLSCSGASFRASLFASRLWAMALCLWLILPNLCILDQLTLHVFVDWFVGCPWIQG